MSAKCRSQTERANRRYLEHRRAALLRELAAVERELGDDVEEAGRGEVEQCS